MSSLKMKVTLNKIQQPTKKKSELECKPDQQLLPLLCKLPKRTGKIKIVFTMLRLGRESPSLPLIITSALQIGMTSMIMRMKSKNTIIFRVIETNFKEVLLTAKMELIMLIKIKIIRCNFNQCMRRTLKLILKIKNSKITSNIKFQSNNLKFKITNFNNFIITSKFVKMFKMTKI
jgi:hypothetical protein